MILMNEENKAREEIWFVSHITGVWMDQVTWKIMEVCNQREGDVFMLLLFYHHMKSASGGDQGPVSI